MRSLMICTAHPILFKSRRMRCAGHVVSMGERRIVVYRVMVGKVRGRDHLGDPCVDGRIILQ
jgi:hypothetical protein